jgi:hypothetical protein
MFKMYLKNKHGNKYSFNNSRKWCLCLKCIWKINMENNIGFVYFLTIDYVGNVYSSDSQKNIIGKIDFVTGFFF